ncbi:MAG: peptidase M14, partial [Ignavibacteria bacterium]|nr:peptidase M14 [Ignavibacteria bacterium]
MKNKNISKDWLTHFEKSNQLESPDYENTLKYFQKFEDNTPYVKIKTIGVTPQGRELKIIIVSKDKAFTAEQAKKTGKAIVL